MILKAPAISPFRFRVQGYRGEASDKGINIVSDYRSGEICSALCQPIKRVATICDHSDFVAFGSLFPDRGNDERAKR